MKSLTDRELMEALKKAEAKEEIDELYNEFYKRFSGYVFKVASQRTRNFMDSEQFAKDLTQETFVSTLKGRKSFKFAPGVTDSECTNLIKGWLGRIANNHFNREIAKRGDVESLDEVLSRLPEPSVDLFETMHGEKDHEEISNQFMVMLQSALNLLKERDKHILLEYAREGCIETGRHLSTVTMDFLCILYSTTPENIRQIKKRALEKIKSICFPPNQ